MIVSLLKKITTTLILLVIISMLLIMFGTDAGTLSSTALDMWIHLYS
ncbi:MAG: hypothetical protein V7782_15665 [Psychromonas sp.]